MLTVKNLKRLMIGPVSFEVADGECLAITGPSGTGKSVLLRAIVDLDPSEGDVTSGDLIRDHVTAIKWRQNVAMLPAESGWWGDVVGPHFRQPDVAAKMLPQLDLSPEAMNWEVARLSSGERHRLALLRCLELEPGVLLLDEPTATLDQAATELVEAMLKRLLAKGTTIILVTHDPEQPARLADKTMHLKSGDLSEVTA